MLDPIDIYENDEYINRTEIENELKHWGILGMHWGIRRYQNPDGTLTPEGRERYSKKLSNAIETENKSPKIAAKAIEELNKRLPEINSKFTGPDAGLSKEYADEISKNMKEIYGDLLKKEYGEIANQLYDDEKEWLNQFTYYTIYDHMNDEYINHTEIENELKHWGILGMKWGIRNYQNPDGSLTPLGRIRYGVGPKKHITGNVAGANDAGSLSDEELRRMTKRYQQQADYYNARNNFIYQENRFKENTAPPPRKISAVGRFLSNTLGKPIENMFARNSEFMLSYLGYAGISKMMGPEMAAAYMSASGYKMDTRSQIEKDAEKVKQTKDWYKNMNDLNEEQKKYNNPDYKSKEDKQKQASNFNKYAKARSEMHDFLKKKATDPSVSINEYIKMVEEAEELYGEYDPEVGFRY